MDRVRGRHAHPLENRTIVVAVDESPASPDAVALGAQLVAQRGQLVFVHVLVVPLEFPLEAPPEPEEEARRQRARDLLVRCQALADRYGVTSRRVLERRHAVGPAIVDVLERHRADLALVGGEQRLSRSGRVRLGPTAAYVLRHARCPVLLVSAGAAAAAGRRVA